MKRNREFRPDVVQGISDGFDAISFTSRRIDFDTRGSSLAECDAAAHAIAREALGINYSLEVKATEAEETTVLNVVVVWKASYVARQRIVPIGNES